MFCLQIIKHIYEARYRGINVGWKKNQHHIGDFLVLVEYISITLSHEKKIFKNQFFNNFEKRRRLFNVAVLLIIIDAHVKYHKAGKGVSFNAFRWKLFRNDLYQQKHKKIRNLICLSNIDR